MNPLPSLAAGELLELLTQVAPRQPVLVWGTSGAGKTALLDRAAASSGVEVLSLESRALAAAAQAAPGLPDSDCYQAPRLTAKPRPRCFHLLGLPEAEAGEARALEDLLDRRRIGTTQLPPDSWLVAEGRGAPRTLPAGLAARLLQVVYEPDADEWLAWARAEDLSPLVLQYLEEHPHRLCSVPEPGAPASTPRSWAAAGRLLAAGDQALSVEVRATALRGLLAPADATALLGTAPRSRRSEASTGYTRLRWQRATSP